MNDLDEFGRSRNSPIYRNIHTPYQGGMDFDAQTDRNVITNAKLRNFSFNAGTGGTIVLGGAGNGNGYLNIKNSAGAVIVAADNTGLTVNDGSITIQNSGGTNIIDATGLISSTNFANNFYYDDTNIATTSTSYVDVTGSSLSFTLSRSTNVLISFYALITTWGNNASYDYATDVAVAIDGTAQSPAATSGWYSTTALVFKKTDSVSCARIFTLASGSHTIKLQWRTNSNVDANMLTRNLNYMVLGS